MESLSLHIEYLLLRHDCVVVPGFGAFINVRQAAWYDSTTRVWHPMTREVRFNGSLTHDDGLLASSLARKWQVSFSEGRELLRRAVTELRESLARDGEVTLGQLGIIRTEDGALSFLPMRDAQRLAAMMGYADAPILPVAERTDINGDATSQERNGETRDSRSRRFNWHYAAAACLLTVVAAVAMLLPKADIHIDMASVLPLERIFSPAPADGKTLHFSDDSTYTAETIDQIDANRTTDSTDSTATSMKTETNGTEETNASAEAAETGEVRYHAVVATFDSPRQAEEFVARHASKGYDLKVVNGKRKSRVSARSSANREELQREIMSETFRNIFAEAWIWQE